MSRRDEILAKVREVPAMPASASEVARRLADPDPDMNAVIRAIEHDPVLTSNILRLANTAYFGGPRTIGSVKEAVMRLGTQWVFHMAVTAVALPMMHNDLKGYVLPAGTLLDHSMATALATRRLADWIKIPCSNYAFTAGLLHDLGKIVLGTFVEVDTAPILRLAFDQGLSFEAAEREILGIDHAEVGAVLLESWNVPQILHELVRCHHEPEKAQADPAAADLVHAADHLTMLCGIGSGIDGLNYHTSPRALENLKLTTNVLEHAACEVLSDLNQLRALFALDKRR
jgi:putative nucleotidyltransferase with HDIG domain